MSIDVNLLKDLEIFKGVTDDLLAQTAAVAAEVELAGEEGLIVETRYDDRFYMLLSGTIEITAAIGRGQQETYLIRPGNFFGAEQFLFDRRALVAAKAVSAARLVRIEVVELDQLLRASKTLLSNLKAAAEIFRLSRTKQFNWLGPDETIYMVARKHPWRLVVALILPVAIGWGGVLLAFIVLAFGFPSLVAEFFGLGIIAIAVVLGAWRWIDWANDFYVVTSQRAVWLERVLWLYDSRREAPMSAMLAIDVSTTQLGRILGYGDLTIRTIVGQINFRDIGQPKRAKEMLEAFRGYTAQTLRRAEVSAMERVIRQKIGLPAAPAAPSAPGGVSAPGGGTTSVEKAAPLWAWLTRYFQMRIEEGATITYRKHWFILLKKILLPSVVCLSGFVLEIYVLWLMLDQRLALLTFAGLAFLSLVVLLVPVLWWLYQYVDWRNDLYRITADKIIDSEKKPLGDELSKSAPLENIQSLQHERLGILGLILNFGDVDIHVTSGEPFTFHGVHAPAQVQKEIFDHMFALRRRKEEAEAAKEHERVANWVAAYHRQVTPPPANSSGTSTATAAALPASTSMNPAQLWLGSPSFCQVSRTTA